MKKKRGAFFEATSTIIGTVIGAGIFGIPFVVAQAGYISGLSTIFIVWALILCTFLLLGEIVLRTKGKHQLAGYAQKYLGKKGKTLMYLALIIGIYGALIAYLIGEGQTIFNLFQPLFGGSVFIYQLIFFVFGAGIIKIGLKGVKKSEFLLVFALIIIVLILSLLALAFFQPSNLQQSEFTLKSFFLPYGVILFAFLGFVAIPEASQILKKKKKLLCPSLFLGSLVPLFIYVIFTTVIVAATGQQTTEIATMGLGQLDFWLRIFGNLLVMIAMATSFLALGLALKETFVYDYSMNEWLAWALTCFVPLFFALFKWVDFIQAMSIAGSIAGGLSGLLIIFMYPQAKKLGQRKPEYSLNLPHWLLYLFGAAYVIGIVYIILNNLL